MRYLIAIFYICSTSVSLSAAELEQGQVIFQQKCTVCHKLPVTGTRSAEQWTLLVEVMQHTMANRGVRPLSEQEQRDLLQYLASTAPTLTNAEETSLAKETFMTRCALCHQLPEPTMLSPRQWQAILITMQTRMQQAGIPVLTQQETDLILAYLSQQAGE